MASLVQAVSNASVKSPSANYYANRSQVRKDGFKLFARDFGKSSLYTVPIAVGASLIKGILNTKNIKGAQKSFIIDNLKNFVPVALILSFLISLFSYKPDKK